MEEIRYIFDRSIQFLLILHFSRIDFPKKSSQPLREKGEERGGGGGRRQDCFSI